MVMLPPWPSIRKALASLTLMIMIPPLVSTEARTPSAVATITPQSLIRQAYDNVLSRKPSAKEFEERCASIKVVDDYSIRKIYCDLAFSQEYKTRLDRGDCGKTIDMLYQSFLNRRSDAGGYQFWLNIALHEGRRIGLYSAILTMIYSAEFRMHQYMKQPGVLPEPISSYDHYMVSRDYAARGKLEEALVNLQKARDEGFEHTLVYRSIGDCESNLKHYQAAERDYKRALALDSHWFSANLALADCYFKQGNEKEGVRYCTESIKLDPKYGTGYYMLGLYYHQLGKNKKAIEYLLKATELGDPTAPMILASIYQALGNGKQALVYYNRVQRLYPNRDLSAELGACYSLLGEVNQAVHTYSRRLATDPKNADILLSRGSAYLQLGRPKEAISDCTAAIALRADLGSAYAVRARAVQQLGSSNRAAVQRDLVAAAKLLRTKDAYLNLAQFYMDVNKPEEAQKQYDLLLQEHPNWGRVLALRGKSYVLTEEYERAVDDLSRAIALNERDPLTYHARATAYARLGLTQAAIDDLSILTKIAPTAALYRERAVALYTLGQLERAIQDMTAAINLSPKVALAYLQRGILYKKTGQLDRALADLNRAITLNPKLVGAFKERGRLYKTLGKSALSAQDENNADELGKTLERQNPQTGRWGTSQR